MTTLAARLAGLAATALFLLAALVGAIVIARRD